MIQKNITKLEHELEGKCYTLLCDSDSPLSSVRAVLAEFSAFCEQIENHIKEAMEKQAEEQKEPEPVDQEIQCCQGV